MFSMLRKDLVYTDVSPDVVEHDIDIEADSWSYDGRDIYRGTFDPRYTKHNLNVYWLYDEDLKRVGLAEHEAETAEVFRALWFYDNPFATLLQNPEWKSENKTLWSTISNEAYQDCLEDEFKHVFDWALFSNVCLITPEMLTKDIVIYHCPGCASFSFSEKNRCPFVKKLVDLTPFSFLFIDDSFILYKPPADFKLPLVRHDAFSQEQSKMVELTDQLELQDAQTPHLQAQEQEQPHLQVPPPPPPQEPQQ
jgi:hypothetical protein